MAELFAYNEKVETIFDLIGDRENDITESIAWAFAKCPRLLERVIEKLIHVGMHGGICEKTAASDTDDYGAAPSMDGDL